jgi:hypothetical protein
MKVRAFCSYYVRSALPFVTGLAFGLFQDRLHLSHPMLALLALVLVVAGPIAMYTLLTLMAEALHGEVSEHPLPRAPLFRTPERTWSTRLRPGSRGR